MSIFQKVKAALSSAMPTVAPKMSVPEDLQMLDQLEPGLGAKALAYIATGENGGVLSVIAQQKSGVLDAGGWRTETLKPRRAFIANPDTNTDLVVRYLEVLAADQIVRRYYPNCSDSVPDTVYVFCAELKTGYEDNLKDKNGSWALYPPQKTSEVVTTLGGSICDVLDVIFYRKKKYDNKKAGSFGTVFDLKNLLLTYPEDVLALNTRMPPLGREQLFNHLRALELQDQAPFDQMVIDALADSSKVVREAAARVFASTEPGKQEKTAVEYLSSGKGEMRAAMVRALCALETPTARDALIEHLEGEKTARIRTMIESYLAIPGETAENPQDTEGYRAIDGSFIEVPPVREPQDGQPPVISDDVKEQLLAVGKTLEERYQQDLAQTKRGEKGTRDLYYLKRAASISSDVFAEFATRQLKGEDIWASAPKDMRRRLRAPETRDVFKTVLQECGSKQRLNVVLAAAPDERLYGRQSFWKSYLEDYRESDEADLRYLDAITEAKNTDDNSDAPKAMMVSGELRSTFLSNNHRNLRPEEGMAKDAVWPLVAENLWLVDRSVGIVIDQEFPEKLEVALRMLATLPKLPEQYGPHLVTLAIAGPKAIRKKAKALVNRNQGFSTLLINLLDDKRQDVRAGAASWLAEREVTDAVKPLEKRGKKEKSPVAKAAILSALQRLGQDISKYVGPNALLAEAEKNLAKANFKDLDWFLFDTLPQVAYRDGTPVPPDVLKWWIALAVKLKTPGQTALFDLYLDQLQEKDAQTLSSWLFDAWYSFDCGPLPDHLVEAKAQQMLAIWSSHYMYYFPSMNDASDDEKLAFLKRRVRKDAPNPGAASKGILALAGKVQPAHAAAKVRSYLKNHGRRTSQALALLELMAAKGDPMSLQVVIAAATRLRQKGVQARASEMIQEVADRNNWTLDELSDRTVPTGGLQDDGRMELPCSDGEKIYVAKLDEKLGLALFNPEGKSVKSLPAGQDEETKESKKALSAAKKEIKQAVAFQTNRLFEAMCCARAWNAKDWVRDFHDHPLMRKMTERLIWQVVDDAGAPIATFRPTPEGEFIGADDSELTLEDRMTLRLAHASTLSKEDAAAWRQHLKDFEVKPLFDQVRKDLPILTDDMAEKTDVEDRRGWVFDTFTLRSAATKAGYERGSVLDGGGFDTYTRAFGSVGIVAVIEFSGNHVQQENVPAALKSLFFEHLPAGQERGYGTGRKLALGKVPPVLLSECWADLHAIAAKAVHDPEWEKVCPW